ncbi:hypothetical protein ATKI12_2749 [Kitasatospora sp. Ki12]
MRQINRALRQARGVVPVVVLTAGLVAGGAMTAAPAVAGTAPLSLTVQPPSSIGAAGGPVEFTETISNQDKEGWAVALRLTAETSFGSSPEFMSLEWQNELNGQWDALPLTYHAEGGKAVFETVAGKIIVPAGEKKEVHLRIGAPMGTPHDGTPNRGMIPTVNLRSEVKGWWQDLPVEPAVQDSREIKVGAVSNSLAGVPAKAVAGGEPIEFDVALKNPTPSAYTNLDSLLITDKRAKVEVRGADGSWTTLSPVVFLDSSTGSFHLDGHNSSAAPGSTETKRVRVGYAAGTTTDQAQLQPCVTVNEPADDNGQIRGTYFCSSGADVEITAAPTAQPTTPAPAKTSAVSHPGGAPVVKPAGQITSAPAGPVTQPAAIASAATDVLVPTTTGGAVAAAAPDGRLAATGADGDRTGLISGVAALLLGAGVATVALFRRRRAN